MRLRYWSVEMTSSFFTLVISLISLVVRKYRYDQIKMTNFWPVRGGIEEFVSILDGYLGPLSIVRFKVHENFQNGLWPVGAIGEQPEIRERFLRCSRLSFHFRELITCEWHVEQLISMEWAKKKTLLSVLSRVSGCLLTELNEQLPISSPLIGRQGQDARHIVIFCRFFFLQEDQKKGFLIEMLLRFLSVQDVANVLCDIRVPLKSTQQYGSLLSHTLSLHKTGRGLCHSIMFCGPGNTWQVDTDSVNNSVKQTKTLGTQIDHKYGVNWKIKWLTLFFLPSISKNEMVPLR